MMSSGSARGSSGEPPDPDRRLRGTEGCTASVYLPVWTHLPLPEDAARGDHARRISVARTGVCPEIQWRDRLLDRWRPGALRLQRRGGGRPNLAPTAADRLPRGVRDNRVAAAGGQTMARAPGPRHARRAPDLD